MSDHNLAEALRRIANAKFGMTTADAFHLQSIAREALAAHEKQAEQQAGVTQPDAWRYQDARGHYRYVGHKPHRKNFAAEYAILNPVPLFTHPQQPLTREQVKALMTECGYDQASPQERADFINGVRNAEKALGIGITKDTK